CLRVEIMSNDTLEVLPYGRQWIDDDDVAAVAEAVRHPWLTQGPAVTAFEDKLCEVTGARYAVACNSGTSALHMAAAAFHADGQDVSITSAVTFLASANCIAYLGGEVAFTDVDPSTALMAVDSLQQVVDRVQAQGKQVRAIIPVDMCGQPVDLPAIRAIADACGAAVIADAAHSLGGRYQVDGQWHPVGGTNLADAVTLSFHPIKHVTTGEGGAVLTNSERVRDIAQAVRCHGMHRDSARLTRPADSPWVGPWYYEQDS